MNISRVGNQMFCGYLGAVDVNNKGYRIITDCIDSIYPNPNQKDGKIESATIQYSSSLAGPKVKIEVPCDGRNGYDSLLNTYNIARQFNSADINCPKIYYN